MTIQTLFLLLLLYPLYRSFLAIWRLYFHPLANFPGPRAAALSRDWLGRIHDIGHPEADFEKLHQEYGVKALRIAPNELHITDVSLYSIIYGRRKPFPKDPAFYSAFNIPHTVFTESDPVLHKDRRQRLSPYFSKASISKLESSLDDKLNRLLLRIESVSSDGVGVHATNAFRCLTIDLISDYAFAESKNMIEASGDDFNAQTLDAIDISAASVFPLMNQRLLRVMGSILPRSILVRLNQDLAGIFALVDEADASFAEYEKKERHEKSTPVIFDAMEGLPREQITAEANDILFAGTDTTAATLTCATWHLSKNPHIKQKLMDALDRALPNCGVASITQLESIPYLTAVVRESLRCATPVPGRLPRIVPAEGHDPLIVDGRVVPPGTVVGMSAYTMNRSEELWGLNAPAFEPDRWLDAAPALVSQLATFSKGSRDCIGQTLATMELHKVLGRLYRSYDIDLDPASGNLDFDDHFAVCYKKPEVLLRFKPRL